MAMKGAKGAAFHDFHREMVYFLGRHNIEFFNCFQKILNKMAFR